MISYAVIGRGTIAEQYIRAAELSGEFALSAVYSRNLETGKAFGKKHGCEKVYTDLSDLAADPGIQAVYIASPNSCHPLQTEILLNSGKHIICEKPITTSAAEYKRLKALADSKGLIYTEAIIPIYVKSRKAIKAAVESIGKPAMARIDFCQLTSRYASLLRGEKVNIFDMSLHAGALMDLGVYCVYAAVDLLGTPKSIKATASFLENGADSSGSVIFEYDGFCASLTYSKIGQSTAPSELIGDKGSVIIDRIGLYSGAYSVSGRERIRLDTPLEKEQLMSEEARAFAEFIKGHNMAEYRENSRLCFEVHTCMDEIKKSAGIHYPANNKNSI